MAYADRDQSGSRIVAIVIVAVMMAALGYAFVTGLAFQYIKKVQKDLNTFTVEEPPPPPEEVPPPPPPPDQPIQPPPVVTPPPLVRTNVPPPVIVQSVPTPPPVYVPAPVAAPPPSPPPAPPPPPRVAKPLQPRGQPQNWVTNDDYPSAAIRAEESGVTGVRLDVGPDGRVTNCTVSSSSGSSLLDNTACTLLRRRARFSPAEDASGNKIAAAWSGRFRWDLPSR